MIVILFTGGTITMRNDPGGGGAQPGLTATEILQATKGIRAITAVETEEWGQFPGPHMTVDRMWALRNRIVEHLGRPEVTGVVITHDTLATQGGRVGHTYGYPGGGRRLEEMGAIFGGSRRAQQARIDLMLALGSGMSHDQIREMFDS